LLIAELFDPAELAPVVANVPDSAFEVGFMLPSTNPQLDDDEEANTGWKLVPYFGAVLLFLWRQFSRAKA
jgi:hypothetical protein